ncbi:transposase family protein [Rhodococcus cerastii]|nr:transposase family protein [Rhodococcus cerastii]
MVDATTLLFGLPGLHVVNVTQHDDGTRIVDTVTDDDNAGACPGCGVFSTSRKQQTTTTPKDIPYGDDRIIVRWTKPDGDAEKATASAIPSPTPSNRYPLGGGPRADSAARWLPRSAPPPAQSPKSLPHILCPGRPRTARSSPMPGRD